MGDRLKKALTRKLGPLPAWAWALIAGAGVWYYRRKLSNAAGDTSQSGQAADTAYYGPYGQDPYGISGGAGSTGGGAGNGGGGFGPQPGDPSGIGSLDPPTINVTTGGGRHRRTRKHKPHHNRQHKHGNQHRKRSHAHTHENHHAVHHTGQHHHRRRRHR